MSSIIPILLRALSVFVASASTIGLFRSNTFLGSNYRLMNSLQHDGLYDQNTLQIYNSHRNVKGVAQENNYAPMYFRNLKNNIVLSNCFYLHTTD